MTQQRAHLLKNGHPAHVFTDEDRRKGAERTNAIRRARRMAFEDEKFERAIALMHARDEARRARRRERYERDKARQSVPTASPSHDQAHPGTQRARAREEPSASPVQLPATSSHERLERPSANERERARHDRGTTEAQEAEQAKRAQRGARAEWEAGQELIRAERRRTVKARYLR